MTIKTEIRAVRLPQYMAIQQGSAVKAELKRALDAYSKEDVAAAASAIRSVAEGVEKLERMEQGTFGKENLPALCNDWVEIPLNLKRYLKNLSAILNNPACGKRRVEEMYRAFESWIGNTAYTYYT